METVELGQINPNVFPLDAFKLTGNQTSAERLISLKAPWKFDGLSVSYPVSGFVSGRGWWTEFADGTLIQRITTTLNYVGASGVEDFPYQHLVLWTFPKGFVDSNYQIPAPALQLSGAFAVAGRIVNKATGSVSFVVASSSTSTITADLIAIGRVRT